MDRKSLLALILCFAIFAAWQKFYLGPQQEAYQQALKQYQAAQQAQPQQTQPQQGSPAGTPPTASSASGTTLTPADPQGQQRPLETMPVEVSTGVARVSNGNAIFTGWDLKSYRLALAAEAAALDLKSVTNRESEVEILFDRPELAYIADVRGVLTRTANGVTWTYEDNRIKIVRETTASGGQPFINVCYNVDFKDQAPAFAFVSLVSRPLENDPEVADRNLIYWTNDDIEHVALGDTVKVREIPSAVKWVGATNRYFVMSLVAEGPGPRGLIQPFQPVEGGGGRISLVYPVSGKSLNIPIKAYFGPKELDLLRTVEPTLDHAIDFGWFTAFAYPLLRLMRWFNSIFHNYGIAIILLTLLVKLVTFPLTYKSMKSMKEMAKLQPQLQKLRDKYKDDKEALNREMLLMMRTHGYNPAAGCLPILVQMPVFFALYKVLYSSIELYHAPFMLWIQDLSAKDPFYVTPILLTLTMYVQQKLTPTTATDPAQQKMMQFMPIIFGAFMLTLPSGLTVYMLVNALASIVQQIILNKKLDMKPAQPVVAASAR